MPTFNVIKTTTASFHIMDVIAALKVSFPTELSLQAIPHDGKGVQMALTAGNNLRLVHARDMSPGTPMDAIVGRLKSLGVVSRQTPPEAV